MREAARALDDVSDHLGEVLRHADELLVEWGQFGAQVRTQVEREAQAIGAVVDGAVERAASAGIDRAIADRLRSLTTEIERIEQRARAASRAVTDQREADRRVLWIVVAGIVLANALLVMLLLRKPEPARAPEPIRIEAIARPPAVESTPGSAPAAGSADAVTAGSATEPALGAGVPGANAGSNVGSSAGASNGSGVPGGKPAPTTPVDAAAKPGAPSSVPAGDRAGSAKPAASPIVLPPKAGAARVHKK